MPSSASTPRRTVLQELARRAPVVAQRNGGRATDDHVRPPTSSYFGVNTFGVRQMRDKLPRAVYESLVRSIRQGHKLDVEMAPVLAQVMKDWAISHGATHFTHWFQPMTGLTAEKHDAFLSFDEDRQPMESFTGAQLIQSEPDASSFPSGGLRATWEARGYTAWNPSSPVFIVESAGIRTLCIPSVFIGYNGEALDEMTPLLRSSDVLSQKAIALLELLGERGVERVYTTLGVEQEYFLVDRSLHALRPDLVMAGRTLLGAQPPRGQQLEDHYFGGIPERIQACIAEVEQELYRLGVPIVTRHNEVAPSQYEMAPAFEETDVAVDHNQMVMATLRKVAIRHGLQALLHEKPFAGINGSGKHCNWSMAIASDRPEVDGVNLLKPGRTPHQNLRFLLFLAAVLRGVHRHNALLRAAIATSGNEHRLGAGEAPPAIISVFMGSMLTEMIEAIAEGKAMNGSATQVMLKLGVAKLPEVEQDNTDRNRTSPFAFTGQKFEFRAVGSSASVAFPITLLNAAVAEAIEELTAQLREALDGGARVDDAVLAVVRRAFQQTAAIRFEGNNYSAEWVEEAARRGLPNRPRAPEALDELVTDSTRATLTRLGILTERELEARYHVRVERYVMDLLIEMHMMEQLVDTMVLPAGYAYLGMLAAGAAQAKAAGITVVPQVAAANQVGALVETLQARRASHGELLAGIEALEDPYAQACRLTTEGADSLRLLRESCDALEVLVADDQWPLPKYREMLFAV